MAQRSGLQRSIQLLKHFCRIYAVYYARMVDAIDAAPVGTSQQKQAAKDALTTINTACAALLIFEKVFEP